MGEEMDESASDEGGPTLEEATQAEVEAAIEAIEERETAPVCTCQ